MPPVAEIETCRDSHRRLLHAVARLTDAEVRAPSSLPGWTRAHVLTHLTTKAAAHRLVFGGPAAGEVRVLFPDGFDFDGAAAAGAGRPAEELRVDLERALLELEAAWDALPDDRWNDEGIMMAGPRTMTDIVSHHLRNIEVHHVDLDIGYRPSDWPEVFVEGELARRLRTLPDRAGHAELLIWLLDRAPAPELAPW